MTAQEIFDSVVNHLLTQNAQSQNSRGSCRYRGPNGTKCAVGHLIPDEVYHPDMEGRLVGAFDFGISPEHYNLLRGLQGVHDFHPVEEWEQQLKRVALAFELEYKGKL
jgi:hypothetical protein